MDTIQRMRRRAFLALSGGLAGCSSGILPLDPEPVFPGYLRGFEGPYAVDPRGAAGAWFRAVRWGLFLRYGVYSQLKRGPAVQFDERIPLGRYAELQTSFDPSGFDAEKIADLAVEAGLGYVGLSARHADGFCLFRTIESDFNSLEACGRDLVDELASACRLRRLGLLLSYSYAADWRHPYFYPPETARIDWRGARPAYDTPPNEYSFQRDEDFLHYIRHAHNQLQEIVYRYRPLAGIRLKPILGYHARPDLFPIGQTYAILREAQSSLLVGFGQGANGDEDFTTAKGQVRIRPEGGDAAADAWKKNRGKPLEIRRSLRSGARSRTASAGQLGADNLRCLLRDSEALSANLLLCMDLAPDGSVDPLDEQRLLEFGRLRGA